jgi:hypothetical protein
MRGQIFSDELSRETRGTIDNNIELGRGFHNVPIPKAVT